MRAESITNRWISVKNWFVRVSNSSKWLTSRLPILHQNFRLSVTLSLLHIIIKEASRYNLVFVP